MKVIILDLETKVTRLSSSRHDIDGSPFNPNNRIVSAHWRTLEYPDIGPPNLSGPKRSIFYHNDYPKSDKPDELQAALDWADMIVAHNAKFDVTYLLEAGFTLPDKIFCTMIGEFIIARGTWVTVNLKDTAIRRGVSQKKDELVSELFYSGIGYEEMDLDIVIEYADGDVLTCAEIFIQQWSYFHSIEAGRLMNIVELMNDMLSFLVEIERNGIAIDLERLEEVRLEYEKEQTQLIADLNKIVVSVMGDTPINLQSPEDVSKVVYSREVVDKKLHKETFNLGMDEDGKEQYAPRMSISQFHKAVQTTTRVVKRTNAVHCIVCNGKGKVRKSKKGGGFHKIENKCKFCDAKGFLFEPTRVTAGLKMVPEFPRDASVGGFSAGKDEIDRLIYQAHNKGNLEAVEFLTKKKRLNAVNVYLQTFVGGIQNGVRSDGIIHPSFNQTIARTGRLSSSQINFQNLPTGRKFPVRECIVSRWKDVGGLIGEWDFSGLEFRVAGELSQDKQIIEDVNNGKDVHKQTASIINEKPVEDVTSDERKNAKAYSFAPLYGGQGANEPPHIRTYFKEFFNIYSDHQDWQFKQMDLVLSRGYTEVPSGRQYCFPGTRRGRGRRTTNATNIVNYSVQGFATADIVVLACVRILRKFKELKLKSLPIITVHDSAVVDIYPGEEKVVHSAMKWAMENVHEEILTRWDYKMTLPLAIEGEMGTNWGSLEEIHE